MTAPDELRGSGRTPTQADLEAWDKRHVWHAFTQMAEYEPLLIERAAGCTLYDAAGRPLLDGVSSLWCNIHGHRHPRLDAALREQLDRVAHTTQLGASNSTTIRLARRLVELAPAGLEHVFFSDDGATAVEVALKMAFQYWRQCPRPEPQRTLFLALRDAYHGDTLGSVSVGGVERFHRLFEPLLFPTLRAGLPAGPPGTALASGAGGASLDAMLADLEGVLKAHHQQIAAMVIEPLVQCAAGILVHPPGYLRGVWELTRRYGVLLVADEVAVGFGRTGTMFACQQEQVTPDFLCLAKGLTGGYLPLAATLTTDDVFSAFLGSYAESKAFFHGHTYGGNPLGAAVALASLDLFDEEQTLAKLPAKVARLREHLARLAELPHLGPPRQCGLIAGIDLVQDKATGQPYPWEQQRGALVCRYARDRGVLLRPLGSTLVVMPPLAISLDEIDQIAAALEYGVRQATAETA